MSTTIIVSHIPKTAGTTLRRHLKLFFEDQEELIHLANRGKEYCQYHKIPFFTERSEIDRVSAKVIIGHDVNFDTKFLVSSNKIREMVVFRSPKAWEVSRYNQYVNRLVFRGQPPISYEKWITSTNKIHSQFDWFLSNYLSLAGRVNALSLDLKKHLLFSTLDQFDEVFDVSDVESMITMILEAFNRNNKRIDIVNQKVVGVDKENYFETSSLNNELLEQTCENDEEIYQYVKNKYMKSQ